MWAGLDAEPGINSRSHISFWNHLGGNLQGLKHSSGYAAVLVSTHVNLTQMHYVCPPQSAHVMLMRRPTAVGSKFCSVIILTKFWPLQRLVELAADQTKLVSQCLCQKRIVNSRETCTNPAIAMINGLITTLVAATVFASGQRCSSVLSAFCCILTGAVLRMLFRPVDGWPMTDCHTHCIILAQG